MSVYSYKMIDDLRTSLGNLAEKLYSKTALVLSPEEALEAFVHPDHVPMLREVQQICSPATNASYWTTLQCSNGVSLRAYMVFSGGSPVIMPRYIEHGLQPTCPDGVLAKIVSWVDQRLAYGMAFGDTIDAISWLNENCGDVRAMALMLPCLTTIMGNMSTDAESTAVRRARKLSQSSGFGSLPRLPVQVKQRLMEISAIVNAVTLMTDAPDITAPLHHALFAQARVNRGGTIRTNIFWGNEPGSIVPQATFY